MFEGWSFISKHFDVDGDAAPVDQNDTDCTAVQSGLMANTHVATSRGWTQVDELMPGDMVLTFDAGLQRVTKVTKEVLWDAETPCPKSFWPLEVPAGAFGNRDVMQILANQSIMVESDTAEDLYGDPFTLIPASALIGLRGIERVPPKDALEVVHVYFADEQVVFGESGTLYLCPSSRDMMDIVFDGGNDPLYSILPMHEARVVASSLDMDAPMARQTPQEVMGGAFA
jgi:hypothetical protein